MTQIQPTTESRYRELQKERYARALEIHAKMTHFKENDVEIFRNLQTSLSVLFLAPLVMILSPLVGGLAFVGGLITFALFIRRSAENSSESAAHFALCLKIVDHVEPDLIGQMKKIGPPPEDDDN